MRATDKAYIAGIIDGEGTIGLFKSHQGIFERRKTPSYSLRVRVKMCDEVIIKWLHSTCGGRYYLEQRNGYIHHIHEWSIVGVKAVEFLIKIYPYLKIKKGQADIAFEFGKTINNHGWGESLSPEIVLEREVLRNRIVRLNARGIAKANFYDKK